jgi:hypothetical protein
MEADASIAELVATIRAGACGVDMKASIGVLITGAVALEGNIRFSGGRPAIRILHQFVNDNLGSGAVVVGQTLPLVGPPAVCTGGTMPCHNDNECPSGLKCETRLTIFNPTARTWTGPARRRNSSCVHHRRDPEHRAHDLRAALDDGPR